MRLLLISLFLLVLSVVSAEAEELTFAGSSTIMPIMEAMTPVFKKHGLTVKIQGGGSSAGIKSVKMGMADIGMVSRSLSANETKNYNYLTLAKDWVVLITHKDSNYDDITMQQVVDIFSGKVNTIKGKKIHVIAKEAGRATKKVFDAYFSLKGKLSKNLIIIGANGQAIAAVANDPNGLAYVSYSAAAMSIKQGESIKILMLDGVAGTPENVKKEIYKLSRALNLVYLEKNASMVKRIRTILSTDEAKKVFTDANVISTL